MVYKFNHIFSKKQLAKLGFFLALLFVLSQTQAAENKIINELNYLGTSGLFFVPTGSTIEYGEFNFGFANMVDPQGKRFGPSGEYLDGNTFSFSLSPFPGLEIGMSNMGNKMYKGSDLIANLKYSPTFIPKNWFDLSVGAVDLGGETGHQRAIYSSLSKQLGALRFTVGRGLQKQNKTFKRYEDGFAGVEYAPFSWLTAIAEYDGADKHVGIKFRTPEHWLGGHTQLYGSSILTTDAENSNESNFFSVGVRTSLFSSIDQNIDEPKPIEASIKNSLSWLFNDSSRQERIKVKRGPTHLDSRFDSTIENLGYLKRVIVKQGFENVWVGLDKSRLIIKFENPVFNRNDLDALGVVMGLAANFNAMPIDVLDICLKKNDITVLHLEVDHAQLAGFYDNDGDLPAIQVIRSNDHDASNALWVGGSRSPYFKPRVSFSPKLRYFVGTELGVYDYSYALRSSIEIPLWKGAVLFADYDHHLGQSEDFEYGRSFYRWNVPSRWSNFVLNQVFELPLTTIGSLGFGRFKGTFNEDYSGLFGELMWQSPNGNHSFEFSGGYYESNILVDVKREVGLGRYRYYWDKLDMSISVETGQYWKQDRGVKVETAFNFGDTKVSFYVQDTSHQLVGIRFSVPLGFEKDMTPKFIQLKGTNDFNFGFGTSVNTGLGINPLRPGRAERSPYLSMLKSYYFNNDRLSIAYIRANKHRLLLAYDEWVIK